MTTNDLTAAGQGSPSARPDLTKYAWLSIAAALVTIALKTGAWWITDSVGLLSDAAESTVNLVAAIVALIALRIAARPADDTHHYGHAKAEFFSAASEGTMIFAAAIFILYTAVQRFLDPQPVENVGVGLAVSVLASLINGGVALVLLRAGRQHRSLTLVADGKHLMTDVWTSAGVVIGVILVAVTGIQRLDPIIAAQREATALRDRNVRLWEPHDGTINLTAKLDVLDARYVDATVTQLAGVLHHTPQYAAVALDVLRAKALGIMAHPAIALAMIQAQAQQPLADASNAATGGPVDPDTGRVDTDPTRCAGHTCGAITVPVATLQPRVRVYIHLNPDGTTAGIEGAGTVAVETLRELLDGKQVKATPVIDLDTIPAEHQYRPTRRMREAVSLVFPTEAFPYSNRSSRGLDLDHTTAYQPSCRDPQTRLGNLAPLSRRAHRAKTAGFWECHQSRTGELHWISPLGFRYIVNKDGTHRIE